MSCVTRKRVLHMQKMPPHYYYGADQLHGYPLFLLQKALHQQPGQWSDCSAERHSSHLLPIPVPGTPAAVKGPNTVDPCMFAPKGAILIGFNTTVISSASDRDFSQR